MDATFLFIKLNKVIKSALIVGIAAISIGVASAYPVYVTPSNGYYNSSWVPAHWENGRWVSGHYVRTYYRPGAAYYHPGSAYRPGVRYYRPAARPGVRYYTPARRWR